MVDTVEDVLFGRVDVAPIPGNQLAAQLAAGRDTAPVDEASQAASRLAQAYNVATQLLIKLHDNGMAWATADRAVQAAHGGGDPMVLAEARRLAATVLRRNQHRDGAQKLMLDAARALRADTGLPDTAHSALYGQLLAAERDAPQEVRFRPWAQQLTADLLSRNSRSLPGVREFADRVGVR